MVFQFDSNVAEKYGVEAAVLIHNLAFWIKKNAANNKHFYEGKFWTYNSVEAFTELFPFWNADKVRRLLDKLACENVVEKGNFNHNSFDRTQWYSLNDSVFSLLKIELKPSKKTASELLKKELENTNIDLANLPNGFEKIAKSDLANLPNEYKEQIINTDNKTQIEKTALAFFENNCKSLFENWAMNFKSQIKDYKHFRVVAESKLETEAIEWDGRKIYYRLTSFTTNYLKNQNNEKQPEIIPQNKLPQSKIIRYK